MNLKWECDGLSWKTELATKQGKIVCSVRSKTNPRGFNGLVEYIEHNRHQEIVVYKHVDDLDTVRSKCEEKALVTRDTIDQAESKMADGLLTPVVLTSLS